MDKKILIDLIAKGHSTYTIAKKLDKGNSTVIYWIKKLGLSELYKNNSNYSAEKKVLSSKYTEDELRNIAAKCNSLTEVIEYYGLVPRGRNFDTIKKYLQLYNISYSHFNPNNNRSGLARSKTLDDYLVLDSKIGSTELKNKLYRAGIKDRICEMCGQSENWLGSRMSLILDHINGNHKDNRLENLRIVCPNCNATLPTHCGKNRHKIK